MLLEKARHLYLFPKAPLLSSDHSPQERLGFRCSRRKELTNTHAVAQRLRESFQMPMGMDEWRERLPTEHHLRICVKHLHDDSRRVLHA